jgi:hypothetical protein
MWLFSIAKAVRKPLEALWRLLGQGMRSSERPNGMEAGRSVMEELFGKEVEPGRSGEKGKLTGDEWVELFGKAAEVGRSEEKAPLTDDERGELSGKAAEPGRSGEKAPLAGDEREELFGKDAETVQGKEAEPGRVGRGGWP